MNDFGGTFPTLEAAQKSLFDTNGNADGNISSFDWAHVAWFTPAGFQIVSEWNGKEWGEPSGMMLYTLNRKMKASNHKP